MDVQRRITRHIEHIKSREAIRVNHTAMLKRIGSYSQKKSGTSQFVAKQYQGIVKALNTDSTGHWYRPVVSAFHTKTGRDHALGSSLNQVPKQYWKSVLSPPKGSVYALLDYQQQEPMIAAYFAQCRMLMNWYQKGDIYKNLVQLVGGQFSRDQCKQLLIGRLYGIGYRTLAEKLGITLSRVRSLSNELSRLIYPMDRYLAKSADVIRQQGFARSLDWKYTISDLDGQLSLANWKIQATGADIMRRACLRLDDANIPLLLTNHDSFLVRLEQAQFQNQLDAATQALADAAADVLNGFRLKVAVEMMLPSQEK